MSEYRGTDSSDSSDSDEQKNVPDIIMALRGGENLPIIDIPQNATEQEITNLLQIIQDSVRAKTLSLKIFYLDKVRLDQEHIDQLISFLPSIASLEVLSFSRLESNRMSLNTILRLLAAFAQPDEHGEVIQLKYLKATLSDEGYQEERYSDTFDAILAALTRTNITRLDVDLAGTFNVREARQFQNALKAMNDRAREQGFGSVQDRKRLRAEGAGSAASSAAASRSSTPSGSLDRASPYGSLSGSPSGALIKDDFMTKFIEKYWSLYNEYIKIDEEHAPVTLDDQKRLDATMRRMLKSVCTSQGYSSLDNADKNRDILMQMRSMGTQILCAYIQIKSKEIIFRPICKMLLSENLTTHSLKFYKEVRHLMYCIRDAKSR